MRISDRKTAIIMGLSRKFSDLEFRPLIYDPEQADPPPRSRLSARARAAFWLALSLVSLLSAALLLLMAHPPPHHTTSSSDDSTSSTQIPLPKMSAVDIEQPQLVLPHLVEKPVDVVVIGTSSPDPSQKSTLPLASNPAVFNEVITI